MDWKNLHHWFYGLLATVITGSSNALLGTLGTAAIGEPLNWHQVGTIALTTGFIGALAYLSKSPLPPEGTVIKFNKTDTPAPPEPTTKPPEQP